MLRPTGFWSYTTSDDTSSRGKLSQLRSLLAAELQQQVGRSPKVNIFQDVVAIPPGSEWDNQIRAAIEDASFIIPIITPGFLQSEWCCRELSLFKAREERLGVKNLIFPLHYVNTDHVDGKDAYQCVDPAVLTFLKTRQWTDFRQYRFRPQDSEEIALVLEVLARGILQSLREAIVVQRRAEVERQAREAAAARAAEEERQRLAAASVAEEVRQQRDAAARAAEAERQLVEALRNAEETRRQRDAAARTAEAERKRAEAQPQAKAASLNYCSDFWLLGKIV